MQPIAKRGRFPFTDNRPSATRLIWLLRIWRHLFCNLLDNALRPLSIPDEFMAELHHFGYQARTSPFHRHYHCRKLLVPNDPFPSQVVTPGFPVKTTTGDWLWIWAEKCTAGDWDRHDGADLRCIFDPSRPDDFSALDAAGLKKCQTFYTDSDTESLKPQTSHSFYCK